jgi:hypothetical protein
MSELSDLFDIQGHNGVHRKLNKTRSLVTIACLDNAGCAWSHRLTEVKGDAEGFEGLILSAIHVVLLTWYTHYTIKSG